MWRVKRALKGFVEAVGSPVVAYFASATGAIKGGLHILCRVPLGGCSALACLKRWESSLNGALRVVRPMGGDFYLVHC